MTGINSSDLKSPEFIPEIVFCTDLLYKKSPYKIPVIWKSSDDRKTTGLFSGDLTLFSCLLNYRNLFNKSPDIWCGQRTTGWARQTLKSEWACEGRRSCEKWVDLVPTNLSLGLNLGTKKYPSKLALTTVHIYNRCEETGPCHLYVAAKTKETFYCKGGLY